MDYVKDILSSNSEFGSVAALEALRLADKYGDFLDCDALVKILGVGRNNVRQLMNRVDFPTKTIGNRRIVCTLAFVLWSLTRQDHS